LILSLCAGLAGCAGLVPSLIAAKIENVELPGHKGTLKWTQATSGLAVEFPGEKPCEHAVASKIAMA